VIRNQLPSVAEALKLPDGVFPVAGLCVGYPAGPGYTSMRLPPTVTIHTDEYQESDLEREVDAYDQRRHERQRLSLAMPIFTAGRKIKRRKAISSRTILGRPGSHSDHLRPGSPCPEARL
jgi:hypothetical protein